MFCLGFLQPVDVKMTGSLWSQFRQLQVWDFGSADPSQDPLPWLGRVFNPLPALLIAPCCYCARYVLLMLLCCPGYSAALCCSAAPQLNPTTFPASSSGFCFFDPSRRGFDIHSLPFLGRQLSGSEYTETQPESASMLLSRCSTRFANNWTQ